MLLSGTRSHFQLAFSRVPGLKRSTRKVRMVLLQDAERLGRKGDIVQVAPGYARNYVYPQRLGVYATEPNVLRFSLPYVEHKLAP